MLQKLIAMAIGLACLDCYVHAQSAEQVIEGYIQAIGGQVRLDTLRTIFMEGSSEAENGTEVLYRIYRSQGIGLRREVNAAGITAVTILTGEKGWTSDRFEPGTYHEMPAAQVSSRKYELDCINALVRYKQYHYTVRLLGTEIINESAAHKVEMTVSPEQVFIYYIDSKTKLLVREQRLIKGESGPVMIDYGNYQKTPQGYLLPMYITGRLGIITLSKVEINRPIDMQLLRP